MLSLRSIWREAHMRLHVGCGCARDPLDCAQGRLFSNDVQDDSGSGELFKLSHWLIAADVDRKGARP